MSNSTEKKVGLGQKKKSAPPKNDDAVVVKTETTTENREGGAGNTPPPPKRGRGRPRKDPKLTAQQVTKSFRLSKLENQRFEAIKLRVAELMKMDDEKENAIPIAVELTDTDIERILIALGSLASDKQIEKAMTKII